MLPNYHILNGDALKERFPSGIRGTQLVARECLVDGPVRGQDLMSFYATRAAYLSEQYGGTPAEYYENVVPEFGQMQALPEHARIYLWFEDDLFCQVNLWFVLYLLSRNDSELAIFLVRPHAQSPYSFGHMDNQALIEQWKSAQPLQQLDTLTQLWPAYQQEDIALLTDLGDALAGRYPFIQAAIKAHKDRIPTSDDPGRPMRTIQTILRELNTQDFGTVFREFIKRDGIYGFGDLQVKQLFDRAIEES